MRLNGWQRLWVVFAVLTFTITTIFVYRAQQHFFFVEGVNVVAAPPYLSTQDLNAQLDNQFLQQQAKATNRGQNLQKLPTRVVANDPLGNLTFSGQWLVKDDQTGQNGLWDGKNITLISPEMAAILEASSKNDRIRQANRDVILHGYSSWLILTVLIYIAGWAVGWIYRGFKSS
jgi:hypothetical protein